MHAGLARLIAVGGTAALVVIAGVGSARAQVNAETLRLGEPEEGLSGDAKGDLTFKHGNVSLLQAEGTGRGFYHLDVHSMLLYVRGAVGSQDGERNTEAAFVHLRWTAMWHPRIGSELFGQLQYDAFLDLKFRALVGAGPRVALWLEDWIELYAGSGYMLEREVLTIPATDPHPRHTLHHRWTNYLSTKLVGGEVLSLRNVVYAQPRFDAFKDVRILDELELQVTVVEHLSLLNSFALRYDSRPPSRVRPLDVVLKVGLRLSSGP